MDMKPWSYEAQARACLYAHAFEKTAIEQGEDVRECPTRWIP